MQSPFYPALYFFSYAEERLNADHSWGFKGWNGTAVIWRFLQWKVESGSLIRNRERLRLCWCHFFFIFSSLTYDFARRMHHARHELHNPQSLDSLRRRANARNVSFRICRPLRWPIHIINPVDKTKLSCNTPHRRSNSVSLETYPLYARIDYNHLKSL